MNEPTHTSLSMAAGSQDERANAPAGDEPFLTPAELEATFKISTSHRLHLDKIGMPHISIGGKRRRYLRSEVEKFLIKLTRTAIQDASNE